MAPGLDQPSDRPRSTWIFPPDLVLDRFTLSPALLAFSTWTTHLPEVLIILPRRPLYIIDSAFSPNSVISLQHQTASSQARGRTTILSTLFFSIYHGIRCGLRKERAVAHWAGGMLGCIYRRRSRMCGVDVVRAMAVQVAGEWHSFISPLKMSESPSQALRRYKTYLKYLPGPKRRGLFISDLRIICEYVVFHYLHGPFTYGISDPKAPRSSMNALFVSMAATSVFRWVFSACLSAFWC